MSASINAISLDWNAWSDGCDGKLRPFHLKAKHCHLQSERKRKAVERAQKPAVKGLILMFKLPPNLRSKKTCCSIGPTEALSQSTRTGVHALDRGRQDRPRDRKDSNDLGGDREIRRQRRPKEAWCSQSRASYCAPGALRALLALSTDRGCENRFPTMLKSVPGRSRPNWAVRAVSRFPPG
jgi:hypothetical protein